MIKSELGLISKQKGLNDKEFNGTMTSSYERGKIMTALESKINKSKKLFI